VQGRQLDEGRDGPVADHRHRPFELGGERAVVRVGRQIDAEPPERGEPLVQGGGQIVLQDLHVDHQAPDLGLVHAPSRLVEAAREGRERVVVPLAERLQDAPLRMVRERQLIVGGPRVRGQHGEAMLHVLQGRGEGR
jgi:hypothetical protein